MIFSGPDDIKGEAKLDVPLDAPNVGANPFPVARRAFTYQSPGTLVNYGETLDLNPGLPPCWGH